MKQSSNVAAGILLTHPDDLMSRSAYFFDVVNFDFFMLQTHFLDCPMGDVPIGRPGAGSALHVTRESPHCWHRRLRSRGLPI